MTAASPQFVHRRLARVVLLRLLRTGRTPAEVDELEALLDTLRREAAGPLLLVALTGPGLTPPSEEIRALILGRIRARFARGDIERAFLILPGAGARVLARGVRLLLGLRRELVVLDSIPSVVRELSRGYGIQPEELERAAAELAASDHDPRP